MVTIYFKSGRIIEAEGEFSEWEDKVASSTSENVVHVITHTRTGLKSLVTSSSIEEVQDCPEGKLLSDSNYVETEKKLWGGSHGDKP